MLPLEGLVILDLARVLACPFASMILAGLGFSSLGRSERHVRDTFLRLEGRLETRRAGAPHHFATEPVPSDAG